MTHLIQGEFLKNIEYDEKGHNLGDVFNSDQLDFIAIELAKAIIKANKED